MHCRKAFLTVLLTLALMGMGWMSATASSTDAARLGESGLGRLSQGDGNGSLFADGLSLAVSRGAGTKEVVAPRGSLGRQAVAAPMVPTLTVTATMEVTHPVGLALATHFDVPYGEIMDWRQQGLGFGGIVKAYSVVEELCGELTPTLTVTHVFSLKLSGTGWGRMFKDLGLSPSNKNRNLGRVMSGRGRGDDDVTDDASSEPEEGDEPGVVGQSPDTDKPNGKTPPGQDRDKDKGKGKGKGRGKGGGKP
jgi:hypothetical protein